MEENDNMPSSTGWVIIITCVAWFIWEMIALFSGVPTISEEIWGVGDKAKSPIFLVGLLCGHFFWSRRS